MAKSLYLECFSGISGDMFVAAMLDLGVSKEELLRTLEGIPLGNFHIHISRKLKSGIEACDFDVHPAKGFENHDHDMEYLHGHGHAHGQNHAHEHSHAHEQSHMHEHSHAHEHDHEHSHAHVHRTLADVTAIIEATPLTKRARELAIRIFSILGEAEAAAHGKAVHEVHFHEVGALDSIVDIIAAAFCIDALDIREVIIPVLYEGCGTVRTQHGILPIPVPATQFIMQRYQLAVKQGVCEGELVTPTGAAIAAAIRTGCRLPERFRILQSGLGAGKRNYHCPGLLRAMLIEEELEPHTDTVYKIESNIDDSSPEALGYMLERLFAAGALDVSYIPLLMKKNRPAYQLQVLLLQEDLEKIKDIIFQESTSIGIRIYETRRYILERQKKTVLTPWGEVEIKECTLPTGEKRCYPEYESVRKLCKEQGLAYQTVYQKVLEAYGA